MSVEFTHAAIGLAFFAVWAMIGHIKVQDHLGDEVSAADWREG